MAYADPALFARLVSLLEDATVAYLSAQIEAGAEVVQIFDSWAGILEPRLFQDYVVAPTARIVDRINAAHPAIPIIGFPRLAGLNTWSYIKESGVDAVGLDTTAGLSVGMETGLPTQGNLDPALLLVGGAALEDGVRRIVAETAGHPHIFNLGHGVSQHTDPGEVARLVDTLRACA
jgi:uroporphyrinogen decarboxylase